ncbi:actin filament-associated protein 1-like isoform X1 [Lethenteron reissneri]|uniref:actin filament-associated protein 1-like isoform X1 n=1 Tax=Lethenteron reissneri TaxID=7753 RepID=UPI002AB7501E|nr:actin filament-associated protein 1-like isoform X1 [Lethenteron reissneri]
MDKVKVLEELLPEIRSLLVMLDKEHLSGATKEKKTVVVALMSKLQPPDVEDKEYIYMSYDLSRNGTSLWQVLEHCWRPTGHKSEASRAPARPQIPLPEIPLPLLLAEEGASLSAGANDAYEVADPLTPSRAPQYTMYMNSNGISTGPVQDAFYEEADERQVLANSCHPKNHDSDVASSSYESYDDEEEDGKGETLTRQWPSEEASMNLVKDSRICAFLLRKKRFGQWSRQLCVIKETHLLCYKSSKDQQPLLDLPLLGCSVAYSPKDVRKRKYELRINGPPGTDGVVLATQSPEQAEEWFKIIREVCGVSEGTVDIDCPSPTSTLSRAETDKSSSLERNIAIEEGTIGKNGLEEVIMMNGTDGKDKDKSKRTSLAELKDSVSKATGKRITRFMGLGKKKKLSEEPSSSEEESSACGYLQVLIGGRWRERWCHIKDGALHVHKERGEGRSAVAVPASTVPLGGCQLLPGMDPKHPYAFRVLRDGQEAVALEAGCNAEMVRWLGLVLSEAGGGTDPVILPYDYVDINALGHVFEAEQDACSRTLQRSTAGNVDSKTSVRRNASLNGPYKQPNKEGKGEAGRHAALSRQRSDPLHYQSPSPSTRRAQGLGGKPPTGPSAGDQGGKSLPRDRRQQDKKIYVTGRRTTVKQQAAALSEQKEKPQQNATVKRNPSNADSQRYGKHRAEADAKRFQAEKEELEKKKERLRCQLAQLKTQRKELKEAMEKCTGGGKQRLGRLEERLHKLEDECRMREQERVELELKITEVKESLKKAQAGGPSLGITIDPKVVGSPPIQSPQVQRVKRGSSLGSSPEPSDTDMAMLPVNCAAMLKRKQNSAPQTGRGHVIQKAKEWEKKGTN